MIYYYIAIMYSAFHYNVVNDEIFAVKYFQIQEKPQNTRFLRFVNSLGFSNDYLFENCGHGEKLEIAPFSEVFAYYLFLTGSSPGLSVTAEAQ